MIKILFHPVAPFIVTILVVGLWVSFAMTVHEITQSETVVTSLKQRVDQENQELKTIQDKLKSAQTPYAQESVIRNELLMQKPGEYIVQMPDLPVTPLPETTQTAPVTPWQEWKSLLKF